MRVKRVRLNALLLVLVGFLTWAVQHDSLGGRDTKAWTRQNSWYHPKPPNLAPHERRSLPFSKIHEVSDDQLPAAELLLQNCPVVKITDKQAEGFIH